MLSVEGSGPVPPLRQNWGRETITVSEHYTNLQSDRKSDNLGLGRGFESHPQRRSCVCQRQLSVPLPSLLCKRAYHAMHWPCVRGLAVYAGVRLSATKTDISALYEPPRLEEDFAFFYISNNWLYVSKQL